MTLELPWPPTLNHYWRAVPVPGKRIATNRISAGGRLYRSALIESVDRQVGSATPRPMFSRDKRLAIIVELCPPDSMGCRDWDLPNREKALLDGLTHAGVWGDDSQGDIVGFYRGRHEGGGLARVTISELTDNVVWTFSAMVAPHDRPQEGDAA